MYFYYPISFEVVGDMYVIILISRAQHQYTEVGHFKWLGAIFDQGCFQGLQGPQGPLLRPFARGPEGLGGPNGALRRLDRSAGLHTIGYDFVH